MTLDMLDIIDRLKSLGFVADDNDEWGLTFIIDKVTNHIKNECNVSAIPEELREIAIDMACGEFLMVKKASGRLDGFEVNLNALMVKTVAEGDTSVTHAVDKTLSPEERLDAVIGHLLNQKPQLLAFRKLRW